MAEERRYTDEEVAAIFRAASEGPATGAPADAEATGLTLREVQEIARQVDLAPEAVSRAARALDVAPAPRTPATLLGLPIAVERSVALDRRLTDEEWELLVVELREVFRARGTIRTQGSLREWSNGNLQALLEPTPTGHRLRMGTRKGNVRASVTGGAAVVAIAAVNAAIAAAHGTLGIVAPELGMLATLGVALVVNGAVSLPAWARLRRRQMDGIVERLTSRTTQGEPG